MTAIFTLVLLAAAPSEIAERVAGWIAASPAAARANWGIEVAPLAGMPPLVEMNARRYFIPASNTKLYSTALALLKLGPQYRFETRVVRDTNGDIRLIGGGDPTMSWRKYPYEKGPHKGEPLAAIEEFADMIVKKGVRLVTGDIIGDDTRWPWIR